MVDYNSRAQLSVASESKTYYQNPKVDYLFGYLGGKPIPSHQDKYKPIELIGVTEDGEEEILDNVYIKNPAKNAVSEFQEKIRQDAEKIFGENGRIDTPTEIEVILSISVTERRFKEVDVDNLAKTVLDGLKGAAFEDDSQVASLIVSKHVHPMKINGIFIGITELNANNQGFNGDIKLMSDQKWD